MEARSREQGQILPMAALILLPLLVLAAFAIDIGSFYHRASELQSASDLAALAGAEVHGAGGSAGEVELEAKEILEANGIDPSTVEIDVQIEGDNISVTLNDKNVDLFFASLIVDEVDIDRDATATVGGCLAVCESPVKISPPFGELPSESEGDGFTPLVVGDEERVFTLNHHVASWEYTAERGLPPINQLVCVEVQSKQTCPGFPKRLNTSTGDRTKLVWHESEGRSEIWYPIQRPTYAQAWTGHQVTYRVGATTRLGLGCVDVYTGADCGSYMFRTVPHGPPIERYRGGLIHDASDFRSMTSQPEQNDGKIYVVDNDMNAYCFDPFTRGLCGTYTPAGDWATLAAKDRVGNVPDMSTHADPNKYQVEPITRIFEDKMYGYWPAEDGSYAFCLDLDSMTPCSGFGTPKLTPSVHYFSTAWFESLDSSGNVDGFCLIGNFPLACVSLSGGALDRSDLASFFAYRDDTNFVLFGTEPVRINEKMFIGLSFSNRTLCIDLVSGTRCGELTQILPYGYTQVPGRDCIMSAGHQVDFKAFSTDFGPCLTDKGILEVYPCECADGSKSWGAVTFDAEFLAAFDSFVVDVLEPDGDGEIISDIDLVETGGRIDLSEVDVTFDKLVIEYELDVEDSFVWTEAIEGSLTVVERATLID